MTPILFSTEAIYKEITNDGSLVTTDEASIVTLAEAETAFTTQGLGSLVDCISCIVTEERNGSYELELTYPSSGKRYSDIKLSCVILAQPAYKKDPEPFRIYQISRPINGIITVNAEHISYQLSHIPVMPFTASSAGAALASLKSNSVGSNPFSFETDKITSATMTVSVPTSCRSLLGGTSGSVLDTYGGEYEFTGYTVKLHAARGLNRGVTIRYGKNLTDLTQEESIANTVTGIVPYWADSDGNIVILPEQAVYSEYVNSYPYDRTIVKDFSQDFDSKPTEAQLRAKAQSYITQSGIGIPEVSLNVSFVMLSNYSGYEDMALLEQVNLCDTVNVQFEELGIDATAKVVKTVFDVLKEEYDSISLGSTQTNLTKTITEVTAQVEENASAAASAIQNATKRITGVNGGYVVMNQDADGQPYEILIMDKPTIESATKVWRWNKEGLGYSSNGYDGPYSTAITSDGSIVADFITAGSLVANNGVYELNMETGTVKMKSAEITGGTISMDSDDDSKDIIKLNYRLNGKTYENQSIIRPGSILVQTENDDGTVPYKTLQNAIAYNVLGSESNHSSLGGSDLLFNDADDLSLAVYGNSYLTISDSSTHKLRVRLDSSGLKFYDSTGTVTKYYSAT